MSETDIDNLTDFADVALRLGTLGTLGVEGRGITTPGFDAAGRAVSEGIGELTGRNLQREQLQRAEARIIEEEVAREKTLVEEQALTERTARQASVATEGIRKTAAARQRGDSTSTLGGGGDFLGL